MAPTQIDGPARVEISNRIRPRQVKRLAADPALRVVQTEVPLDKRKWALLDELLFAKRPDVQLRVYGHFGSECDLSLVRHVPHVRDFSADCLQRATNVEAIAEIPHLEALGLDVFDLESFDVLSEVPPTLHTLTLGQTRSKKPNLAPLARFEGLRTVYIDGHIKNIEVLGQLTALEEVTLRSVTTDGLGFLTPLKKMWSLDVKLGGTSNLDALAGMTSIKYLELWQIRGLADIGVVSDLPGLQNIFLQSLPQVQSIPTLARSHKLRRIVLEQMKGLTDLSALETAPALEEFVYINARGKEPTQLLPVLRNATVNRVSAWFGSAGKNKEFERLREEHGKTPMEDFGTFEYQ